MKIKFTQALAFLFIVLCFISCSDPERPDDCRVSAVVAFRDDTVVFQRLEYVFDNDNLIRTIQSRKEFQDTIEIIYKNGIVDGLNISNNYVVNFIRDDDGRVIESRADFDSHYSYFLRYDEKGRLDARFSKFHNDTTFYTYDDNDNLIKEETKQNNTGYIYITENTYIDKPNHMHFLSTYFPFDPTSKSLIEQVRKYITVNGKRELFDGYDYVYEFNSNGLPVKQVSQQASYPVKFEYLCK